ncbi:MAG TPA: response regulator transcription factor [Oligoflexus sp.]|uniref:response regulator transcription factor n=1 Tax=Oligoflexus sp. TaxID=1971216 RepID=UPI002D7E9B87|nr:response regulator transcription factor [Oligoflexus sp.]HET9239592.1 response regulator transcription factor [Oligoflexus sp.]
MKQAKVFIVEDNLIFRMGLKELLSQDERFLCIGEADNGLNALSSLSRLEPDIVLLDLEMPRFDGVQFLRELWTLRRGLRVLILSQDSPKHRIQELLDLGIDGHIMKVEDSSEILRGLHALAEGQKYFSAKMGERYYDLLREYRLTAAAAPSTEHVVAKLSPREKQIALLIAEGKTNKDMARILECSEHTIKCHKANLMRKMGVQNSAEVVAWTSRVRLL